MSLCVLLLKYSTHSSPYFCCLARRAVFLCGLAIAVGAVVFAVAAALSVFCVYMPYAVRRMVQVMKRLRLPVQQSVQCMAHAAPGIIGASHAVGLPPKRLRRSYSRYAGSAGLELRHVHALAEHALGQLVRAAAGKPCHAVLL